MDFNHPFNLQAPFNPTGDQPKAIDSLVNGLFEDKKWQVLLGATGTGKTFTMANVIQKSQRPAIILVHNKTLAAQEYGEFKELFPHNRVEFFISNFDFYQPEAYIPKTDTYIDKSVQMNQELEMMRAAAVNSLLERHDTIVVATVASIFGLTDPTEYRDLAFTLRVGEEFDPHEVAEKLVIAQYHRDNLELEPSKFRIKGDILEFMPPSNSESSVLIRVYGDDDKISQIDEVDPTSGDFIHSYDAYPVYPAYEHASGVAKVRAACKTIRQELDERLEFFNKNNKPLEYERLKMRTEHDLESLEEFGMCPGIENYARHLDGRKPGETPYTLFDYLPKDYILFIDESHVTIPQVRGMYNGDRARKMNLVDFGFRLPSALDNRPLKFEEFEQRINQCIFVSATPADYEKEHSKENVVEQIIRPTGLLDPKIEVKPVTNQVDDLIEQIRIRTEKNERVLVTTLTKKMAEDLSTYLAGIDIKVKYMHSDTKALERMEIIRDLRLGQFDVLVGINLLREGLDIPEVSLVAILDADKEGFLRSERSLIQTIGRAARNTNGKVIMYADELTESMEKAISETNRRRKIQEQYNKEHNITPKTIQKSVRDTIKASYVAEVQEEYKLDKDVEIKDIISKMTDEMLKYAADMEFEKAAKIRDKIKEMEKMM